MAKVEQFTHSMSDISNIFLHSLPPTIGLGLFENHQIIKEVSSNYIKNEVEKAKKEGYKEALVKIARELKKKIDEYILFLTKIANIVSNITKKEFKTQELKITTIRTNFYFDTRQINILFIIDGDIENEIRFSSILNEVEKAILKTENFIAELFYINSRNRKLDKNSIECDYPFFRKIKS